MHPHFKSDLAGEPRTTKRSKRDETPVYEITPRVLTPQRARAAKVVGQMLSVVLALLCVLAFFKIKDPDLPHVILLGGVFWVGAVTLQAMAEWALRCTTTIVMTPEAVAVRQWGWWQHYPRSVAHSFVQLAHDKTQVEWENLEFKGRQASAEGQTIKQDWWYAKSFHVAMMLAGQRVDLVTVYGQTEATAILQRLQYVDRALDAAQGMGGGISQRPKDDWTNGGPGGLRHE